MLRTSLWLSLLLAFIYGQLADNQGYETLLSNQYPEVSVIETVSENDQYSLYNLDNSNAKVVLIADGSGYGGNLVVSSGVKSNEERHTVTGIGLLKDFETQAYVERLRKKSFFRQFEGKSITDDFVLGRDIDGYSGATVTAKAVTQAVRMGAHGFAVDVVGAPVTWQPPEWHFGLGEVSTLVLVLIALVTSSRLQIPLAKQLKLALPIASLIFVGFYNNASISLGSLGSILLGYFPEIRSHPIWWMMMGGVFVGILFLGRNIYCDKLCPFSTVQSMLNSISGIKWRVPRVVAKNARRVILGMMWAGMMLIFISRHPSMGSYEPFSMMFSLEGYGFQWYILPLALFGSIFVPEFWCRLFCPVGLALNESVKLRRKVFGETSIKVKNV